MANSINTDGRRVEMKRLAVEAMGLGLLVSVGLLSAEPAYAGANDNVAKCSLRTLRGQYLVAASGTLFPPAFGVAEPSTSEAGGYSIYNGDGTGTDYVTFTIDGINANVTSPTPTAYTLKSDCTGTKTVLPDGPHFNIYVAFDGSGLTAVATDTGFAVSESDKRTGP
jgi:hypothetical protein